MAVAADQRQQRDLWLADLQGLGDGPDLLIIGGHPAALQGIPLRDFQTGELGRANLASEDVKNANGEVMAASYQWTFTTGTLALTTPPPISPLIADNPPIQPDQIKIIPRIKRIGVDLAQEIDIIFPDAIDPNSFDLNDILMSVEAVLGDPNVPVPQNLKPTATIVGNRIKILITGW